MKLIMEARDIDNHEGSFPKGFLFVLGIYAICLLAWEIGKVL